MCTCIEECDAAKNHGPYEDQGISGDGIPDVRCTPDVLDDVVSVTLNNVV